MVSKIMIILLLHSFIIIDILAQECVSISGCIIYQLPRTEEKLFFQPTFDIRNSYNEYLCIEEDSIHCYVDSILNIMLDKKHQYLQSCTFVFPPYVDSQGVNKYNLCDTIWGRMPNVYDAKWLFKLPNDDNMFMGFLFEGKAIKIKVPIIDGFPEPTFERMTKYRIIYTDNSLPNIDVYFVYHSSFREIDYLTLPSDFRIYIKGKNRWIPLGKK